MAYHDNGAVAGLAESGGNSALKYGTCIFRAECFNVNARVFGFHMFELRVLLSAESAHNAIFS